MLQDKYNSYIRKTLKVISYIIFTAFICAFFIFCLMHRGQITPDLITNLMPNNQIMAAVFMILIFGLKSLFVFIYCGILYAACGMIFPIPIAILVNVIGTAVMISVPYFFGRRSGSKYIEKIVEKHPKMSILNEAEDTNSFLLSFAVRVIGILPYDMVSAYFGARGISYGEYLLSGVLGSLPGIVAFSIMGMSAHDVTSPVFLISAGAQLFIMLLSVMVYILWVKR